MLCLKKFSQEYYFILWLQAITQCFTQQKFWMFLTVIHLLHYLKDTTENWKFSNYTKKKSIGYNFVHLLITSAPLNIEHWTNVQYASYHFVLSSTFIIYIGPLQTMAHGPDSAHCTLLSRPKMWLIIFRNYEILRFVLCNCTYFQNCANSPLLVAKNKLDTSYHHRLLTLLNI